jgi:hypothetical protein
VYKLYTHINKTQIYFPTAPLLLFSLHPFEFAKAHEPLWPPKSHEPRGVIGWAAGAYLPSYLLRYFPFSFYGYNAFVNCVNN